MNLLQKIFLPLILTFLVSGCALFDRSYLDYPQKGEVLVLHQALTIPADTTGLYIQEGQVSGNGHSRFDPYCEIRVRKLMEIPQVIQPDSFLITRSRGNTRIVRARPIQLASSHFQFISYGRDDAPSDIIKTVELKLYSEKQPDVILLECGGAEDVPGYAFAPGKMEIQRALGKIATLSRGSAE